MFDAKKVSLVIPTLNEEGNLGLVLKSLPLGLHEVIVVDGHSSDKTVPIAKKFGATVLFDEKGKGSALRKGMQMASGEIIIMMDADCSHLSTELTLLVSGIEAGYDICMGSRFIQGGGSEDITFIRKLGNKALVHLVNRLWRMNYSDLCYGYRALRRDIIPKLSLESDGFGIETEISIKAAKAHLSVLEVPSFEKLRFRGSGKLKVARDGAIVLKRILKELFRK
ncbi:MAG: glycosyltransferase family 2 protein [Candidatus Saganbacteria bacterium]|nr:glycosyltransferase family 2 protein [Candidatus Saganbacteria bacterium]